MKFVIRKIPERDTSALERELPGAIIYNDVDHIGALMSFRKALALANDDAVYVQDDMILCKDFQAKALRYIQENRNSVIVFANFCETKSTDIRKEGFYHPRQAGWLLCTYIPKRLADLFLEHNATGIWVPSKRMHKGQFDDIDFCRWLEFVGEYVFLTVPNLAGHPKNVSSICKSRPKRMCPNFDYENSAF